jgi:hypothetical protein
MAFLGGMAGRAGSAARMMGTGAKKFSGYGPQLKKGVGSIGLHGSYAYKNGFSNMGKMRMGAAAGGAIGMSLRDNQKRGAYNPKSSATGGLQPKSSGGMGVGQF